MRRKLTISQLNSCEDAAKLSFGWLISPTGATGVLLSFSHDLPCSCKPFSATSQPQFKEGEELVGPSASSV